MGDRVVPKASQYDLFSETYYLRHCEDDGNLEQGGRLDTS